MVHPLRLHFVIRQDMDRKAQKLQKILSEDTQQQLCGSLWLIIKLVCGLCIQSLRPFVTLQKSRPANLKDPGLGTRKLQGRIEALCAPINFKASFLTKHVGFHTYDFYIISVCLAHEKTQLIGNGAGLDGRPKASCRCSAERSTGSSALCFMPEARQHGFHDSWPGAAKETCR